MTNTPKPSDRFKKFVERLATQLTTEQALVDDKFEYANLDFEGAYDSIIKEAKELLL